MQVLKFGGSSLATRERRQHAIARIRDAVEEGPVVVVVSAPGSTTDRLVRLVEAPAPEVLVAELGVLRERLLEHGPYGEDLEPALRRLRHTLELAATDPDARLRALGWGEVRARLWLAQELQEAGVDVDTVDARAVIHTRGGGPDAAVDRERTGEALRARVFAPLTLLDGYRATGPDGRPSLLGRNGSDTTATEVARALRAERVVIYTDVDGVYTADPSAVPRATPVGALTYREAAELAHAGATVLHPRSIAPARDAGIPVYIRDPRRPQAAGTRVDALGAGDPARATCLASVRDRRLVHVDVGDERPAGPLGAAALDHPSAWLLTQGARSLTFVTAPEHAAGLREALPRDEGVTVRQDGPVAVLTLVAEAMGQRANVAGRLFATLGAAGVRVRAIGQSAAEVAIHAVVDDADHDVAVTRIHDAFHLARQPVSLLVLGKGTVGRAFLDQLGRGAEHFARQGVELRVVGLADRRALAWDAEGLADPRAAVAAAVDRAGPHGPVDDEVLDGLAAQPLPVLVDLTSEDLGSLYEAAFARGIHVVGANKRPLSAALADAQRLEAAALRAGRSYRHETTVGAALPVLEPLDQLLRTGDRVRRIEGSLSGTLGWICDRLHRGDRLSDAVHAAWEAGLTEPHPADDLSGLDVARKALILARRLGLALELDDVEVEPLVDRQLLQDSDPARFVASLGAADAGWTARIAGATARGQRLRYLAVIDADAGTVQVGPRAVSLDHAAASLRGTASLVAFTTERYPDPPLVVVGPGAGAEVTAAGVVADVLRVAEGTLAPRRVGSA